MNWSDTRKKVPKRALRPHSAVIIRNAIFDFVIHTEPSRATAHGQSSCNLNRDYKLDDKTNYVAETESTECWQQKRTKHQPTKKKTKNNNKQTNNTAPNRQTTREHERQRRHIAVQNTSWKLNRATEFVQWLDVLACFLLPKSASCWQFYKIWLHVRHSRNCLRSPPICVAANPFVDYESVFSSQFGFYINTNSNNYHSSSLSQFAKI